jgi:hypothetical protein
LLKKRQFQPSHNATSFVSASERTLQATFMDGLDVIPKSTKFPAISNSFYLMQHTWQFFYFCNIDLLGEKRPRNTPLVVSNWITPSYFRRSYQGTYYMLKLEHPTIYLFFK